MKPLAIATSLCIGVMTTLFAAQPRHAFANDNAEYANVETAGERAHFAQNYCGESAERVNAYKKRMREIQHDASNFDQHWQTGWRRGERDAAQMEQLRVSQPDEFAWRVKSGCERIRWLAKNAVRQHAPK